MQDSTARSNKFDIVLLGGGLAASLLALSVIRKRPQLKLLIIERSTSFPRKVGESTSDITGYFLNNFGIDELLKDQIHKTGLRFLFNEKKSKDPKDITEFSSPVLKGPTNGFHLNRAVLDERLLDECRRNNITVFRPATILESTFAPYHCKLKLDNNGVEQIVESTWFIDASGNARYIKHRLCWEDDQIDLNTGSVLAHFENLAPSSTWDRDEPEYWINNAIGPKALSTIHFMRPNCWWWHIKIDDTHTSLGMVYNKDHVHFEDATKFFDDFIANDAQLSLLTQRASRTEVRHLPHLPYVASKLHSDGIALIGDSGSFVDPLFSPGIEFICQQTLNVCDLLIGYFDGEKDNARKWDMYDRRFVQAFKDRAFMYQQGYKYMGSYDLFSSWMQIGLFGYFTFSVLPSTRSFQKLKKPFILNKLTKFGYGLLIKRYDQILRRRKRQNRISSSRTIPISYTHVAVPKGLRFYLQPIRLLWVWGWNYFKIELTEFASMFKR